jgi:FAD/FMN-containing dehydrogenase/Fe-S oxidoreductase
MTAFRDRARRAATAAAGDPARPGRDAAPPTWTTPFVEIDHGPRGNLPSNVERLVVDLLNDVRGDVRFDAGSRALYATDASNYRQLPIGVVAPRDADDVIRTVEICRAHDVPIVSRGGGTSLAGQTCNVAVVLDHSKYNNDLLELDADEGWARVRPGIVLDELRDAAERHHLTFGPDPATHDHCTLGGMIGNNSCGVHSVMAGKTDDNVLELDVLAYDGTRLRVGPTTDEQFAAIRASGGRVAEIYERMRDIGDRHADEIRARFPDIPRRVSGYNLPQLLPEHQFNFAAALVGSESTLMTVLEAKVRLVPSPPGRVLVVLGYDDVYAAGDDVARVVESGCIACEGMDEALVRDVRARGIHPDALRLLPEGHGFLLVEFGGADRDDADGKARKFASDVAKRRRDVAARLYDDPSDEGKLWKVRESGLGVTAMVPGKPTSGPGWEDSAVPPERLGDYLRAVSKLWDRYGYSADMYGHFGQGVLHCRIDFDLVTEAGLASFRRYMDEAAELVVGMGGSLSGEHGDGQARGELLPVMFGKEIVGAFEELKDLWDPTGRMNPGKLVRPAPILADLRLGADYSPPRPRTFFRFPEDGGSFGHAAFRCVGVGECRRHEGGVMCPSYMVTREERHSTRGRAHLLFELMNGGELAGGWRNDDVEEALDLCLACKGCKGECPVNVDMATYKAEFRAHHYAGRLRPRAAYSMGLIHWWAGFASRMPRVVNAIAHAPLLSGVLKVIGGIAPEREVPRFADQTFRSWWRGRTTDSGAAAQAQPPRDRVILWVDTFNDHFHPQVAQAAVKVLEAAGCDVVVPERPLCCGRPLYDWGYLGQAKRLLKTILSDLRDEIRSGTPIVGLEPSCVSVFRDEATNLLHGDNDARRLAAQAKTLTEFLAARDGYRPPHLDGQVLVHGHCHDKSVLGFESELAVLRASGLEVDAPDSGCCGMAGSFGFERGDHYRVSKAVGERALLPAVRDADPTTYVVADGFSCREQIEQGTRRAVLHAAELLALALEREGQGMGRDVARDAAPGPS